MNPDNLLAPLGVSGAVEAPLQPERRPPFTAFTPKWGKLKGWMKMGKKPYRKRGK